MHLLLKDVKLVHVKIFCTARLIFYYIKQAVPSKNFLFNTEIKCRLCYYISIQGRNFLKKQNKQHVNKLFNYFVMQRDQKQMHSFYEFSLLKVLFLNSSSIIFNLSVHTVLMDNYTILFMNVLLVKFTNAHLYQKK